MNTNELGEFIIFSVYRDANYKGNHDNHLTVMQDLKRRGYSPIEVVEDSNDRHLLPTLGILLFCDMENAPKIVFEHVWYFNKDMTVLGVDIKGDAYRISEYEETYIGDWQKTDTKHHKFYLIEGQIYHID